MFTGLIHHTGRISGRSGAVLAVECPELAASLALGDSVAVNGACLTVARLDGREFTADLLPETTRDTTLGKLAQGTVVNLETALRSGDELGGHFVQGHVDGVVRLLEKVEGSNGNWLLRFENPDWLKPLIPRKASIAVDGISLTVQETNDQSFTVAIIPSTLSSTNLHNISTGMRVNIEADMIVKAVVHALKHMDHAGRPLTEDKLRQMGYM